MFKNPKKIHPLLLGYLLFAVISVLITITWGFIVAIFAIKTSDHIMNGITFIALGATLLGVVLFLLDKFGIFKYK